MSFRFWRRIRLAPGVTLNLSKSNASLSLGPRGAKYTISPLGNRATVGLPGTGLFYTVHDRGGARRAAPKIAARDRLRLGFFRRLVTPAEERALVEGLAALEEGDQTAALDALERGQGLADAAWMAGMIRLRQEDLPRARQHLDAALSRLDTLGDHFEKYGVAAQVSLPVTDDVLAHVLPRERGTRLALVEIAQLCGDHGAARRHLDRLLTLGPDDPVVVLSFAELALDTATDTPLMQRVVALTDGVENETAVHTAILLYRARALAALGLADAAVAVLTLANRRRKDRPADLLRQVRYDRAVLHERAGRKAQARRAFEKLYGEAPDFADLRVRLGLVGENPPPGQDTAAPTWLATNK